MTTIRRAIGRNGRNVNAIGLGCMGMSAFYGAPMTDAEGVKLLHAAIDAGVDHFDTAEMYGVDCANEKLLGAAFHDRRDRISPSSGSARSAWPSSRPRPAPWTSPTPR
jgi:aryl-alcohol dehydrogenase-like predicted oxidoreductase